MLGFCRGVWAANHWTMESTVFGAENLSKVAGFSLFGGGIVILTLPTLVSMFKDYYFVPIVAGRTEKGG